MKKVLIAIILCVPGFASAQGLLDGRLKFTETQMFGMGLSTSVHDIGGIGYYILDVSPKRPGGFFELVYSKNTVSGSDVFAAPINHDFETNRLEPQNEWVSINSGITVAVEKYAAIYLGVGYSRKTVYEKYFDPSGIRGDNGTYWIENEEDSEHKLNVLGGFLFSLPVNLVLRIGITSYPNGVNLGLSYMVTPFWEH